MPTLDGDSTEFTKYLRMGPMKRYWGITKARRGRLQSPIPAAILGVPLAWSAEIDLAIEALRPEKGALEIQAPSGHSSRAPTDTICK